MTEDEWLNCTDPTPMLGFLEGNAAERKVRLHAVACCRRVIHWTKFADEIQGTTPMTDGSSVAFNRGEDYRTAILVAEQFADGEATEDELAFACEGAEYNLLWEGEKCDCDPFVSVAILDVAQVARTAKRIQQTFLDLGGRTADGPSPSPAEVDASQERVVQADLVRDVFGNPFRPVILDPSWLTTTVLALATGIYQERAFDRMPILADAVQDAGCDNDDILNHCRDEKQVHVRGCWVVDLVLGKS